MGLLEKKEANVRRLDITNGSLREYRGKDKEFGFWSGIEGRLTDIRVIEKVIKGDTIKMLQLTMVEGGETFLIQSSLSGAGTNIIASLANIADIAAPIKIEVYSTRKDDKTYTNATVSQNGEKVRWADVPKPKKVVLPSGKTAIDDGDKLKKLVEYINEINRRIVSTAPVAEPDPDQAADNWDDDDIPPSDAFDPSDFPAPEGYAPSV